MAIGGLFKKKEDDKPAASSEVPDELPPLGEDVTASVSQAPPSGGSSTPASAEPPEELPSLEEAKPEAIDVRRVVHEEMVSHGMQPVRQEEHEDQNEKAEAPEALPDSNPNEGFFAGISKQLKDGKPIGSLISHDLLDSMKENWSIRKESSKTGLTSSEEKRVNTSINDVLTQLRLMESKWRAHKLILDEYEKLSHEQEDKIREKEKELKSLLKSYKIYQHVPDDKIIMHKDSIPIINISDAINALRTMDNAAFAVHVSGRRNDFARFAGSIDKALGAELKGAKSKAETLRILEAYTKKLRE
jgi:hypothetical protein